jgi:PAS domain S-box-containing protein
MNVYNEKTDMIKSQPTLTYEELELRVKNLESQLEKANARPFNLMIDLLKEGIWQINKDTETTYVNRSMAKMLGYKPEEMTGLSLFSFMSQENREKAQYYFQRRQQGINETHDFEFLSKTGQKIYTRVATTSLTDPAGEFKGAIAVVSDMTGQRSMEEKMKENEEKYRTICDNMIEGLFVAQNGRIVYSNPALSKITGYTTEEVWGSSFIEAVHKEDRKFIQDHYSQHGAGEKSRTFQVRVMTRDKGTRRFNIQTKAIQWEGQKADMVFVHDVTDKKVAEKNLSESENRFGAFMTYFPGAAFIKDKNNRLLFCNEQFASLIHTSPDKIIGTVLHDNKNPELQKKYLEENKQVIETGKQIERESSFQSENGKTYWLTHKFPIQTGNEILLGAISINITKRKEHENALKNSKKELLRINATKDKLFSIISHDLKNPINNIIGFANLINKKFDQYPVEKTKKFIRVIHQSAISLSELLGSLLIWSRAQSGTIQVSPEYFDLQEIIQSNIDLLKSGAENKQVTLINTLSISVKVYADKEMIKTVIRNILSNAVKFTETGGSVSIGAQEKHSSVIVEIQDDGIGMDQETMDKIFQFGEAVSEHGTEGEKGTGLGLLICREFIRKNNGELWVQSAPGKGSTFFIAIPKNKI